jgi:hypothetical protein
VRLITARDKGQPYIQHIMDFSDWCCCSIIFANSIQGAYLSWFGCFGNAHSSTVGVDSITDCGDCREVLFSGILKHSKFPWSWIFVPFCIATVFRLDVRFEVQVMSSKRTSGIRRSGSCIKIRASLFSNSKHFVAHPPPGAMLHNFDHSLHRANLPALKSCPVRIRR